MGLLGGLKAKLHGKGEREGESLDWRSDARKSRHLPLKIIVTVVIFAALCAPVIFVNNVIGYLPPLTMVLVLVLSFGYLQLSARSIVYGGLSSKNTCPRNTDAKFLVRFKNKSILVITRIDVVFRVSSSYGSDDVVKRFSLALNPRSSKDFEYGIRFAHVGRIELGVQEAVVHDPLGLFWKRLPLQEMSVVEVTPRVYTVSDDILKNLEMNESKESMTPFQKDGMDYMGVREYELGDPMKTIHWKLSARMETLYTRLFETSGNPGIDVLCDLYSEQENTAVLMSIYDAVMELGLSFHQFGVHRSLRTDLLFYDQSGSLCRFSDNEEIDHRELLRRMPLPSARGGEGEMARLVSDITANTQSDANLIVITSHLSERLIVSILESKGRGKHIHVALILPRELEDEQRKQEYAPVARLTAEGVQCTLFDPTEDVQEVTLD